MQQRRLDITMDITRCKSQSHATLDEFYGEMRDSDDPTTHESGETMLGLIARLKALPDERHVYGLTSHYTLCLLSQDTDTSPWFVKVAALDQQNYSVECLVPDREAPWPGAYVLGQAQSEDDAVHMIIKAMDISGGWS